VPILPLVRGELRRPFSDDLAADASDPRPARVGGLQDGVSGSAASTAAWRSEVVSLARRPLPIQLREARAIARGHLERVANLEDSHIRFLRHLDQGHIRPDRLELDEVSRERVRRNPGLLWRLRTGSLGLEER